MNTSNWLVLLYLLGLATGASIGWFLWRRPLFRYRQGEKPRPPGWVPAMPVHISERDVKHHIRYLGTCGFANPDGSPRVPTPKEVVEHGWEPASYLTDPIPDRPRLGLCGVGKTDPELHMKLNAAG